MSVETRCIDYVNSKVTDNTFDIAFLIAVYENLGRCEFKGTLNGVTHYYTLIETYHEATETVEEYYTYEYILQKNRGDQGVPPEDGRILDLLYITAQDLPKDPTDANNYKNQKTQKTLALWKEAIKNELFSVPVDIKDGIDFIDCEDADLNTNQLQKKYAVINWIYKLNARNKIEAEVGDFLDLLADLSKRVAMNERLLLRLANERFSGVPLEQDYLDRYGQFCAEYIYAVDNNLFTDRVDYEQEGTVFQTLLERFNMIGTIVNNEYLSLKK